MEKSEVKKQSPTSITSLSMYALSKEEKTYLKTIKITKNDPACVFNWRDKNIIQLITIINKPLYNEALPPFPITIPMTISTFKRDIITHAATQGGGSYGDSLLAPNTIEQFVSIAAMLTQITISPFFQTAMQQRGVGLIADMFIIKDKSIIPSPLNLVSPFAPNKQMFH